MLLRKYKRYRLEIPVIFSLKGAREIGEQQTGVTRDLSSRGAFIFTAAPPLLDANVKLKAFLPPSSSAAPPLRIQGEGQVVRVEPAHGGYRAGFAVAGERFVLRKWED